MDKSLEQAFNRIATEAYKAFPEKLGRLAVVCGDMPVYISPQITDALSGNTGTVKQSIKNISDDMAARGAIGHARKEFNLAGTAVDLIAYRQDEIPGLLSSRYTREMEAIYTLNHEIGHHVVRDGSHDVPGVSQQRSECAAEIFAMLRQIQIFGMDTDTAKKNCEIAAYVTILSPYRNKQYTAEAMLQAEEVAKAMGEKFFKLSLKQTAELAAQIADEVHDNGLLEKIRQAYEPVYPQFGYDTEKICRRAVEVMQRNKNDADIIRAGKQFLNYPLLKNFITAEVAQGDRLWRGILAFIETPEPPPPLKPRLRQWMPN